MFYLLFGTVFLVTLAVGRKDGPRRAVAFGWLGTAFLLPFWLQSGVGSMTLDLRTAAVAGVLVAVAAAPTALGLRLCLADALIALVVLAQVAAQHQAGGLRPLTVPEIARKWVGPYLMGRLLLGSPGDIPALLPVLARLMVGLSAYAAGECFLKVNFLNVALGKTYALLEQGEGYRWGLKRAHATFDHPIFFGMGLVLLLPWALEGARLARAGDGPRWWRWLPAAIAAALFATVSRGPQLAGMACAGIYLFYRVPRVRLPIVLAVVLGGATVVTFKDEVIELLAVVAGEKAHDTAPRIIMIEGEEVEYTGTNHRVLLFRVYDDAIRRVGMFGYGTELKGIELEESIAQRFASIDCHYLLFLLQAGYVGIGSFLILTLATLLKLGRLAFRRELPHAALGAGLFGALLAVAVLLVSVWFSPDFAGVWLFSAGVAASLLSFPTQPTEQPVAPPRVVPATAAGAADCPRHAPVSAPLRPLA